MACNSSTGARSASLPPPMSREAFLTVSAADLDEFLKISRAVGTGFIIMGVVGYVVKLSMCPRDLAWMES